MRAIWCAIGFAFAICVAMCAIRDEQGDEQDAWAWAGACIGLMIVALALYAWEYTPTRDYGFPPPESDPRPIIYDQTIDERM